MRSRTWVFIILGLAGVGAILIYAYLQRQRKTEEMLLALEEADYDKGREAVEWLIKRGRAVVPRLNDIVAGPAEPPARRWRAAMILGETGGSDSVDSLIEVLAAHLDLVEAPDDDQMAVTAAAAAALGRLGATKAAPELTQLVGKSDAGLDVRCAAARALGRMREKNAIEELAAVLADHPPVPPEEEETDEGAEADEAEAEEEEVEAEEDLTIPLRIAACEALAAIGDGAAVPYLIEAADREVEPDLGVRRAATAALGVIGSQDAVAILVENLQDVEEEPAAEGDPIPDTDGDIRVAAAIALGRTGGEQARSALQAALQDKHYWVRRASASSLRELQ